MKATISHNLKDPHSKALEPDCLPPRLAIATQPLRGEGGLCMGALIRRMFWSHSSLFLFVSGKEVKDI
jgi:hypothetical protein